MDIILGMDWLRILGEVKVNWRIQTTKFDLGGKKIELKVEASLCRIECSTKIVENSMRVGNKGF